MIKYTVTNDGAAWLAKVISGLYTIVPNVMYIVYSNGDRTHMDISKDITEDSFKGLSGDTWYIRMDTGVIPSIKSTENGVSTVFSCIVDASKIAPSDGPAPDILTGSTNIIAVALGYTDGTGKDTIIAVSNMIKDDAVNPVRWLDNVDIAVSVPIEFTAAEVL